MDGRSERGRRNERSYVQPVDDSNTKGLSDKRINAGLFPFESPDGPVRKPMKWGKFVVSVLRKSLDQTRDNNPGEYPLALADVVINYSSDPMEWISRGVDAKDTSKNYMGCVSEVFYQASRDSDTTREFLRILDEQSEKVGSKLGEDFILGLTRDVLILDSSPQAVAAITSWAVKKLPAEESELMILKKAAESLHSRSGGYLALMATELENLGNRGLASIVDEIAGMYGALSGVAFEDPSNISLLDNISEMVGYGSFEEMGDYFGYNSEYKEPIVTRVLFETEPELYRDDLEREPLSTYEKITRAFASEGNESIGQAGPVIIGQLLFPARLLINNIDFGTVNQGDFRVIHAKMVLQRAEELGLN